MVTRPRVIRWGITRTVYLVGRWAIKVPSLRGYGNGPEGVLWSIARGILANQCEATWTSNGDDAEPICPVRWSLLGGLVNVYPRCEPVELAEDGSWPEPSPAVLMPVGDRKPGNVGWYGDRVVWVDYDMSFNGCPHDPGGIAARQLLIEAGDG